MVVEVKGYPSDKYVNGKNKGKKKRTYPKLQAKHWFSEAMFHVLNEKCKDWENVSIAIGLPRFPKYEEMISNIKDLNEKIGIIYYLVNSDGEIEET